LKWGNEKALGVRACVICVLMALFYSLLILPQPAKICPAEYLRVAPGVQFDGVNLFAVAGLGRLVGLSAKIAGHFTISFCRDRLPAGRVGLDWYIPDRKMIL